MTDRINHATTAEEANRHAMTLPRREAARWHAKAQVHATLALVEQQRIQNVISLMQMQEEIDENTNLLAEEALHGLIDYERQGNQLGGLVDVPVIRSEIREALGLS